MGTERFIGRVGALAVALGIGAAVNAMPLVAAAETPSDSSSSAESSTTSSETESGSTVDSKPAASVDNSGNTLQSAADVNPTGDEEPAADQDAEEIPKAPQAADEESDDDELTDAALAMDPEPSTPGEPLESELPPPAAEPVASAEHSDNDCPPRPTTDTSNEAADPGFADKQAVDTATAPFAVAAIAHQESGEVVSPLISPVSPIVQTNAVGAEVIPPPSVVPPVGRMVSGVLSWLGLSPLLTGGPTAPAQSPLQWGLLEWVRRQIRHTLFNRGPTVAYNPAENSQSADGVITGDLHAVDPDGDPLTFTVTRPPEHGTLVVNTDGTFTYTPDAEFRRTAVRDTFMVTVDDSVAYRLSGAPGLLQTVLHRFAQTIGLSGADAVDSHPDIEVNPVIATIDLEDILSSVAVSPDGDSAYVVGVGDNVVSVIDTVTNTVIATVPVGEDPFGVAVRPDGARAYVTNRTDDTVSVINTVTNTVIATIPVGNHSLGVAVRPDGARAYVTNMADDTVSVIDTANNTVAATISVGDGPVGVAVSPDGARVYVTNYYADTVAVIDTAANTVIASIPVGNNPEEVAVGPDGARVYVTNVDQSVSIIDTALGAVIDKVVFSDLITDVAVSPDGARIYVTNYDAGTLLVIDTASNSVVATVSVGALPSGVAASADGSRAYVTHVGDGTVAVIAV